MRKLSLIALGLMVLVLGGCSANHATTTKTKTNSEIVRAATTQALKPASKTWTFSQAVSSKQTKKGVSDTLTPSVVSKTSTLANWTTSKGDFMSYSVKYKRISFDAWKKDQRSHYVKAYQKKLHYMTVTQVNVVLKKLGANFKISKMTDLVYLKTQTGSLSLNQAFVAKGHHLYGINIQYMDTNQTKTIDRGTVFTDTTTKKAAKHIAMSKLNGTWVAAETTTSANDSGKILVKDGYLYQHRYDSYERSAIQDLSKYSLATLNQNNTYAARKTDAAKAGYQLTNTTVASGDSVGYLYLFINQNKLIRIGQGQATTYDKTSATVAVTDLPQNDLQIFELADQKLPGSAASTITVKADAPVVGISDSIKYLTDPDAGQITTNRSVSRENGQLILNSGIK